MPKATRYSPTYERRRVQSYGATRLTAGTPTGVGIAVESYLRIKKRGALTWSTRYMILRSGQLVWFNSKQDAQWRRGMVDETHVIEGRVMSVRNEPCLVIKSEDGKELIARAFSRGDLAKWITAFERLAVKREAKQSTIRSSTCTTEASPVSMMDDEGSVSTLSSSEAMSPEKPRVRRVTFHRNVLVRLIPAVTDEEASALFYSREDMERFSAQAASILYRTEEAVSCAYQSFRPSSMSCRKEIM
ncbi:hypothetical protein Poli38472_007373 [Pythium oligandrum]|uniref:PH domain-containing protein n=1 Tax=Pythium oligandrum TaxID=41045 RepID=A0A8K1CAP3_PYTOL|nr:hypothetical protein Poli38472_007373 [Pythium oligandrum]|eukprot:TMW59228.1 hypothetical protein Poli38472_007373 [Pythium oligandrum]